MKFKFLPLKLIFKDPTDNKLWEDHLLKKPVPPEDKALFNTISRIMKSKPGLIADAGKELNNGHMTDKQEDIKKEIFAGNLDETAKQWINEWESGKEKNGKDDGEKAAIRNFVSSSFKDLQGEHQENPGLHNNRHKRTRFIVYSSSIAAAVIFGAILLFRPFSGPALPDDLFKRYYQPFNVVNNITRGSDTFSEENISKAIESYKHGDYNEAVSRFSEALKLKPSSNSATFFLGIAKLGSGDINGAVISLEEIMNNQEDFATEATWYLGLAYLKSGNKEKAGECFGKLSRTSGYYSREAGKIIRHLK